AFYADIAWAEGSQAAVKKMEARYALSRVFDLMPVDASFKIRDTSSGFSVNRDEIVFRRSSSDKYFDAEYKREQDLRRRGLLSFGLFPQQSSDLQFESNIKASTSREQQIGPARRELNSELLQYENGNAWSPRGSRGY